MTNRYRRCVPHGSLRRRKVGSNDPFVRLLEGSMSNVIGLPMKSLADPRT
jgi:predicted house-cleaning NTP pyrophosphatase (Maf/HAM1 superfamily)